MSVLPLPILDDGSLYDPWCFRYELAGHLATYKTRHDGPAWLIVGTNIKKRVHKGVVKHSVITFNVMENEIKFHCGVVGLGGVFACVAVHAPALALRAVQCDVCVILKRNGDVYRWRVCTAYVHTYVGTVVRDGAVGRVHSSDGALLQSVSMCFAAIRVMQKLAVPKGAKWATHQDDPVINC